MRIVALALLFAAAPALADDAPSALAAQGDADRQRATERAWAVPVLSFDMCVNDVARADARDEIAKERKAARAGGGVLDLRLLYELQQTMRQSDEDDRRCRRALTRLKAKRLPCTHPDVTLVESCQDATLLRGQAADPANPCHADRVQALLRTRSVLLLEE